MLQPVLCLLIGVDIGTGVQQQHVDTAAAQKELMGGVGHDLAAEVPEQGVDLGLGQRPLLDLDARRHRLLALYHRLPVQLADQ